MGLGLVGKRLPPVECHLQRLVERSVRGVLDALDYLLSIYNRVMCSAYRVMCSAYRVATTLHWAAAYAT